MAVNCSAAAVAFNQSMSAAAAATCPIYIDPLPTYEPCNISCLRNGGVMIHILILIYMFCALAIVCDEYFVPSLEVIIERFNIPPDVAGATLMAAGGSMPELFTSIIGTFQGSDVGFGTIVGSAVFNVLFVIGCCAIFAKETLQLTWWPLFRDCVCYSIALLVLATFFGIASCQEIHWYEALILLGLYGLYCLLMTVNTQAQALVTRMCCRGRARVANEPVGSEGGSAAAGIKETSSASASAAVTRREVMRGGEDESGGGSAGGRALQESSVTFHADRVESTFRRPMSVRVGVLTALLDESPLLSSAALVGLRKRKGGLRAIFDELDRDRSGFIEGREVRSLLERLWERSVDESEVDAAIQSLDTNRDARISFEEFSSWYLLSDQRLREELDHLFDAHDLDGDGRLTPSELRPLLVDAYGQAHVHLDDAQLAKAMGEIEGLTEGDAQGSLGKAQFGAWYTASLLWEQQKASAAKAAAMQQAPDLWSFPDGGWGIRLRYGLVFPLFFLLHYTIFDVRNPKYERFFALSFLASIAWIGAFSFVMVWMATSIGVAAGIPSVVMGLTFLAAGTSIPDLLTSVIVAKQGEGDMAVSSSIGSNIFDVLVGLPFPWLLYAIARGVPVSVTADSLFTSILILFLMLAAVISTIAASHWRMTRALGATMFGLYGVFVMQDLLFQFCSFRLPDSWKPCSKCG